MLRITGADRWSFLRFVPSDFRPSGFYSYFPTMLADARSCFHTAEATAAQMEQWSGRVVTLHWFPLPSDLLDWFAASGLVSA